MLVATVIVLPYELRTAMARVDQRDHGRDPCAESDDREQSNQPIRPSRRGRDVRADGDMMISSAASAMSVPPLMA